MDKNISGTCPTANVERLNFNGVVELWPPHESNLQLLYKDERESVMFRRDLIRLLNKLSPPNFCVIVDNLLTLLINNPTRCSEAIDIIAYYAINDSLSRRWYVEFISSANNVFVAEKVGNVKKSFKLLFYEKIEELFFDHENNIKKLAKKEEEIERSSNSKRKNELRILLEEFRIKVKRESLGICLVIGELYKLKMTPGNSFGLVLEKLLSSVDEISLECACKLLNLTGEYLQYNLDHTIVDKYFNEIQAKYSDKLSLRIRCILQNLLDLKEDHWIPRYCKRDCEKIDRIFNGIPKCKRPRFKHFLMNLQQFNVSDFSMDLIEKFVDIFKQGRDLNELLKNFKEIAFKDDFFKAFFFCVLKLEKNEPSYGRILAMLLRTEIINNIELVINVLLDLIKDYIGGVLVFNHEKWNGISEIFKILMLEKAVGLESSSVLEKHFKNNNNFNLRRQQYVKGSRITKRKTKEVKKALNEVTNQQFDCLIQKIQSANSVTELENCIRTLLSEATENPNLHPWYIQICKTMSHFVVPYEETKQSNQFRLVLLYECWYCQAEPIYNFLKLKRKTYPKLEGNIMLPLEETDQIFVQKRYNQIKFICELLKLHQTCENDYFQRLFSHCIGRLLTSFNTNESLEYLCRFVEEFGKQLETEGAIITMRGCLNDMEKILENRNFFPQPHQISRRIIKKIRRTVKKMKEFYYTKPLCIGSSAFQKRYLEIFEEHLYFDDVDLYLRAFENHFSKEEMTEVIIGIIYEVIINCRHPRAVEVCGKLIARMLEFHTVTSSQFADVIIRILPFDQEIRDGSTSLENRRNSLAEILGIIFSKHSLFYESFEAKILEKCSDKTDYQFLTVVKKILYGEGLK